jgi:hypothetical protein
MYSSLLTKARNLHVTLYLCSGRRLRCKLIDFDDMFCEVLVRINTSSGEFAATMAEFDAGDSGWREDRILVNMSDISLIA